MSKTEKIAAIREAMNDALEAASDFRRIGALSYARDMDLMAQTCLEQIARLEQKLVSPR